ncbi:BREX system Lon protease-like protein BrxL [Sedimentimonas flavescens]|uniref:BREX system Lon protease-like protein BrxL n=1 Tax=Sedimentimonas flavescens TaxID=2851012 RepID=UPI001C4A6EFE|nr:BREX system Lon protease-like protein BrxL [Sedimentimonas flavescens]MBW0158420.1 BREX system Lon protease-like protein BrxL [Sedimentimonas flavescens]
MQAAVLALTLSVGVEPKRWVPSTGTTKRYLAASNAPWSLQSASLRPIYTPALLMHHCVVGQHLHDRRLRQKGHFLGRLRLKLSAALNDRRTRTEASEVRSARRATLRSCRLTLRYQTGIVTSGDEVTFPKLFVSDASGKIGLVGYPERAHPPTTRASYRSRAFALTKAIVHFLVDLGPTWKPREASFVRARN